MYCVWTYPEWGDCPLVGANAGTKKRNPVITQMPYNGHDGDGVPCPGEEEQLCPVPCEGSYGPWSLCASPSGNYPPFKRSRSFVATRQPINGGTVCPGPQEEPCLPEVCYYAENPVDSNFGFNGRKQDMRPLRTLPPDHVALKPGTSTLLASCPNVNGLTRHSILPSYNASYDEKCSGPDLFFAIDSATSMSLSGMDKDETAQLFLLQNAGAELFFGIMNGKSAPDGDDSFADIRIDLKNINNQNKGVDWQVQNDPASASNAGKSRNIASW